MVDRMRRRHFQALLPIPRPGQCVEGQGERIAEPFGDRQRSRQACLLVFERAAVQLMPEVHQIRQPIIQRPPGLRQAFEEVCFVALGSGLGQKAFLADTASASPIFVEVSGPRLTVLACRHIARPHRTCRSWSRFFMCLYRSRSVISFEA